jgi:cell wall-associated NlpC family hydrolase
LWGVYRLKDAPADPLWRDKVVRAARAMKGKHYDGLFQWGDDRIYCSELVWKAYRRGAGIELAPLERIGDLDVSAPPVQRLIKSRLRGRKLNLDEPVVTPGRLYASDKIESVFGYL